MAEYAPAAIRGSFDAWEVPGKVLSGIKGDSRHVYGYHRCRLVLTAWDYSKDETPLDRQGDGWACSALDVSLPPLQMIRVTAALIAGLKAHDPRLRAVREVFGTVDGKRVAGWDQLKNSTSSSDASHLWHVHLSFFRVYANDVEALLDVARFVNDVAVAGHAPAGGGSVPITTEEDPLAAFTRADLVSIVREAVSGMPTPQPGGSPDQPFGRVVLDVFANVRKIAAATTADAIGEAVAATPIPQWNAPAQPFAVVMRETQFSARKAGTLTDDALAKLAATVRALLPTGTGGGDGFDDEDVARIVAALAAMLRTTPITLGGVAA